MNSTLEHLDRFLDTLELPPAPGSLNATGETRRTSTSTPANQAAGFVIDGNLVAFTAGLHGQHREDVIDSVLFASLAAQARHPREQDPTSWLNTFRDVLEHVGWAFQSFAMNRRVGVDETTVVDELIQAAGTDGQLAEARRTVEAFGQAARQALGYAPDLHLSLGAPREPGGPSTLTLATATSHQEVPALTLAMGLWQGWTLLDTYRGIGTSARLADLRLFDAGLVLNESVYAAVRQQIREKLGPARSEDVAELWPEGPTPRGATPAGC